MNEFLVGANEIERTVRLGYFPQAVPFGRESMKVTVVVPGQYGSVIYYAVVTKDQASKILRIATEVGR